MCVFRILNDSESKTNSVIWNVQKRRWRWREKSELWSGQWWTWNMYHTQYISSVVDRRRLKWFANSKNSRHLRQNQEKNPRPEVQSQIEVDCDRESKQREETANDDQIFFFLKSLAKKTIARNENNELKRGEKIVCLCESCDRVRPRDEWEWSWWWWRQWSMLFMVVVIVSRSQTNSRDTKKRTSVCECANGGGGTSPVRRIKKACARVGATGTGNDSLCVFVGRPVWLGFLSGWWVGVV